MDISIMIEGQNGLNWPRWERIVRLVEDLGFYGLYRSDHFTNRNPPNLDSLELWTSLTWLASNTKRIQFGPLVTPVSYRHPVLTARMAAAVDDLSGGRLTLGLGAGWQDREHQMFGFDLLSPKERFDRHEEGVAVVHTLLNSQEPVNFSGKYFRLDQAVLLPRPQRTGGPSLLIGGNGSVRTLKLAVRYASEWNGIFLLPVEFKRLSDRLTELLYQNGRDPDTLRRTVMTGLFFGKNQAELAARISAKNATAEDLKGRGIIVGTPADVVDQLGRLAAVGVQGVMLQWLDLEDLNGLQDFAAMVLPEIRNL